MVEGLGGAFTIDLQGGETEHSIDSDDASGSARSISQDDSNDIRG